MTNFAKRFLVSAAALGMAAVSSSASADPNPSTHAGRAKVYEQLHGSSLEAVGRSLRTLLQFVPDRLGDDPWRRKW